MIGAQQLLDVVAHNLANVSTNGYKREGLVFNEQLKRAMFRGDGKYVGELGAGGWLQEHFTVMEPGNVTTTGNALDLAIQDAQGLFAVQTPAGVRYTRDGSFAIDGQRRLVTHEGLPVLDDAGREITLPSGTAEFDSAGQVSVNGSAVAKVGVYAGRVTKVGDGLYEGANMAPIDEPALVTGALEGSNVNAIEEMIAMIQLNRIYEMAQRGALSQDEMTQKLLSSVQDR